MLDGFSRRMWAVVLVFALIGAGAGLLRMYLKDYPYNATATVYVTPPISSSAGDALTADQYAANRTQLYLSFIESPELARVVMERLELNQSPEEFVDRVEGEATPLTSLLSITASGSSPADARNVATAYADELPSFARSIEGSGGLRGAPSVVTVALPIAEEPGFVQQYGLLIALMVAVGLFGALYSYAYQRRYPNVRTAEQLRHELHTALAENVDIETSNRQLRRLQAELLTAADDRCLIVVGATPRDHAEQFSESLVRSLEDSGRTGTEIIEIPALLESSASAAALHRTECEQALIVTRYNVTSLREVKEVRDLLAMNNIAVRGAIILRRSRRPWRRDSTRRPAEPTTGDDDSEPPWPTIDVLEAEKHGRPVRAD